jgi:hypothetical protein
MHDQPEGAIPVDGSGGGIAPKVVTQLKPLTVPLSPSHRIKDFVCARSDRIQRFLYTEALELIPQNYCRVFVLPNPQDATHIFGYYTLSSAGIQRSEVSTQHQKKIPKGLPVPMALIGYMGRNDCTESGIYGALLIRDAALRVYQNPDIASWGIALEPENDKLATWYEEKIYFKRLKTNLRMMYCPLKTLLPELFAPAAASAAAGG